MIKINHINVELIAEKHYIAICPEVLNKIKWCKSILEAFVKKDTTTKQSLSKKIHYNTKNNLLNLLFFDGNKLTKEKKAKIKDLINNNNSPEKNFDMKVQNCLISLLEELEKSLDVLIKGKPINSKITNDDIEEIYKDCIKTNEKLINELFDYKKLIEEEGYNNWTNYTLTRELHAKTCFYCNGHHTHTITNKKGKKKGSPTLDHFFDKATYPLLQLNFYNLIPSCYTCNSICKGKEPFNLDNNIHPYIEGFDNIKGFDKKVKFKWYPKDVTAIQGFNDNNTIELVFPSDIDEKDQKKIENNISIFGLEEAYNTHNDIVQELILKKQKYPDNYLDIISTFFDGGISREEAYRLAFGNYYDEKDFHKRPLSKLTHDIAQELGLIP